MYDTVICHTGISQVNLNNCLLVLNDYSNILVNL